MIGGEAGGEVDDGKLGAGWVCPGLGWAGLCGFCFAAGGRWERKQEDLSDGRSAAGDGMGGVLGGVEVEEFADDDAGAGFGVLGQGEGLSLGEQGVVGVVGDDQSGLLGGGDFRRFGGGGVLADDEALVSALAEVPENAAHGDGGGEQNGEEDGLVAGDHG